jgi:hypothetical protein
MTYSSYVFRAQLEVWSESHVVLAYEYDSWHAMSLGLFPRRARLVLFGDGKIALLKPREFMGALCRMH